MIQIEVEAEVRPTEDIEKVKRALMNIASLDDLEVEELSEGYRLMRIKCTRIECLNPLRSIIKIQGIEPTVRAHLKKYQKGGTLTLLLHKQAAYAGRISLIDSERESPLGPIKITVVGSEEEISRLIDYLTAEE